MTSSVPARLRRALEHLDLEPRDRVLEIGCGNGVLASLVCERLSTGRLVAIDRSERAIRTARTRNAEHVAAGTARFEAVALAAADFGGVRFHRALAVNVNLFWMRPSDELAVLRRVLMRDALLCLVYEPPSEASVGRIAKACCEHLTAGGFRDVVAHGAGRSLVCIKARR